VHARLGRYPDGGGLPGVVQRRPFSLERDSAMSLEANKALVQRWLVEVVDRRDADVEREIVAPDVLLRFSYRELGRAGANAERRAFPDLHRIVSMLIAEGDYVVVHGSNRGTHLGTFDSPLYGAFPPTGKRIRWQYTIFVRIVRGKIVEIREHHDWLGLLEQLGARILAPPPPQE
jgi:predicted ester cyclase